ncbi:MAG: signal recognition particle protein [SAR202 cluster bacterium]|nr:signal recognition particle protein [SAR202 cluster bacterium]
MFETLSDKLNGVFSKLGNKGRLTEKDVDEALREVRKALLEADVNFKVARDFVARIRARAVGEDVLTSLSPGQMVVKITNEELTKMLGSEVSKLTPAPRAPSVVLMVGLNGSGKTTTSAKLARLLKQGGQMPLLIACDLQRPAAIQQLETLGGQIDVEVYKRAGNETTVQVARDGIKRAVAKGAAWAIVDTAGRFQIDDELMKELEAVKAAVNPVETILVLDAMTGQEAVNAAKEFNTRIGVTGLVMSKLDGDARGGAALSIVSETGVPIKFMGIGERVEALEPFYPDRLASRILGMGDVLTFIEKAQQNIDQQKAMELEKKLRHNTFDLDDFLGQLQQIKKMGPLSQVLDMVPGFSAIKKKVPDEDLSEKQMKKVEAIICSMTAQERKKPEMIDGSRRRRIAQGSGTTPQDVNQLLNQFRQMQKMMKQMSSGKGMRNLTRMFQ